MKKEKKENYLIVVVVLLTIAVLGLLTYSVILKMNLNDYTDCLKDVDIDDVENENMMNAAEFNEEEIVYDCSFTRTYNIVNILDDYVAEVPFLSYVVVDAFQDNYARTHVIPVKLKAGLDNGKKYEFTYTLKGTGKVSDMGDIYDLIMLTALYNDDREHTANAPSVLVTLSIQETDKVGMEQKQEPICQTN